MYKYQFHKNYTLLKGKLMKKYFLVFGLYLLNSLAFAFSENIKIKFDQPRLFSNTSIEDPIFLCEGYNKEYKYNKYSIVGNGKDLDIHIKGIYLGDDQSTCDSINNIKPYFIIKKIVVRFTYNKENLKCTIDQKIGLDYINTVGIHYDKLIGENAGLNRCVDDDRFFYVVVNGDRDKTVYQQGYIKIYLLVDPKI